MNQSYCLRAHSLEKTRMLGKIEGRKRGRPKDEMVGWRHRLNGHEFEQTPGDSEGQGSLACCSSTGSRSDATERLNNNKLMNQVFVPGCRKEFLRTRQSVSSVTQSCPTLCNPMDSAHQASLSITNSQRLLKLIRCCISHQFYSPSFALATTNRMQQERAFPPEVGPSQITNMDRPEQSLGASGVWETVAFLTFSGANAATKCKMKPAHSCTFWRPSP